MLGLRHNYLGTKKKSSLIWYDTHQVSGPSEGKAGPAVGCVLPALPTHSQITEILTRKQKKQLSEAIIIFFIGQALPHCIPPFLQSAPLPSRGFVILTGAAAAACLAT